MHGSISIPITKNLSTTLWQKRELVKTKRYRLEPARVYMWWQCAYYTNKNVQEFWNALSMRHTNTKHQILICRPLCRALGLSQEWNAFFTSHHKENPPSILDGEGRRTRFRPVLQPEPVFRALVCPAKNMVWLETVVVARGLQHV